MTDTEAPDAATPPKETDRAGRGERIGLAILFAYVVLLAVGTVAELLDIRWILDLPIY
jgi:hypothetical protein